MATLYGCMCGRLCPDPGESQTEILSTENKLSKYLLFSTRPYIHLCRLDSLLWAFLMDSPSDLSYGAFRKFFALCFYSFHESSLGYFFERKSSSFWVFIHIKLRTYKIQSINTEWACFAPPERRILFGYHRPKDWFLSIWRRTYKIQSINTDNSLLSSFFFKRNANNAYWIAPSVK